MGCHCLLCLTHQGSPNSLLLEVKDPHLAACPCGLPETWDMSILSCPILLPQLHPSFQTCSFQHGTQTHPPQARVWLHIPRALPDMLLCPPLMEQVATLLSTNIAPSLQVPGPLPAALGITIPEGGFFFLPPPEFVTLSTFPDRFIVLS